MGKGILRFGDIETENNKFYRSKTLRKYWESIEKVRDIENVLVSSKNYFCEKNDKYFIGYLYNAS